MRKYSQLGSYTPLVSSLVYKQRVYKRSFAPYLIKVLEIDPYSFEIFESFRIFCTWPRFKIFSFSFIFLYLIKENSFRIICIVPSSIISFNSKLETGDWITTGIEQQFAKI